MIVLIFVLFAKPVIAILTANRYTNAYHFARILSIGVVSTYLMSAIEGIINAFGFTKVCLINKIIGFPKDNLANFIGNSIELVCDYLDIKTRLIMSSSIEKNNSLKAQDKILDICSILKADTYINAIGGQELYKKEDFAKEGIRLDFIKSKYIEYPQFKNEFVPWLSIIDVMMFNSVGEISFMLDKYDLV